MAHTIQELDDIRAQVKTAAQRRHVEALVAGDVDDALAWLEISRYGSLEEPTLRELGFNSEADSLYTEPPEEPT